jgi:spore germination protein YaaH
MKPRLLFTLYISLALLALPACASINSILQTTQAIQPAPTDAPIPTRIPITGQTNPAQPTPSTQTALVGSPPAAGSHPGTQMIGFFVNWDDNSFASLKANFSKMDELVPEWVHLTNDSGDLERDNPAREQEVLDFLKQQGSTLRIVPLFNNYSNHLQDYDSDTLAKMLANPKARKVAIQTLLGYVQKNQFAGTSIDFEGLDATSQPDLVAFMQELYAQFHPLGLEVSISVPVDDDTVDFPALAKASDFLILMTYDQHWDANDPGPIAGQNWFNFYIKKHLDQIPASQLVIGIGNYGYDWTANSGSVDVISFEDALDRSHSTKAQPGLNPTSLNPNFAYSSNNQDHQVWYLDAVTTFNQLVAGRAYAPRGYALWVLGSEDPGIWQVFDHRDQLDQSVANSLETLTNGYGTTTSQPGKRTITYDPASGLITNEQILTYPTP